MLEIYVLSLLGRGRREGEFITRINGEREKQSRIIPGDVAASSALAAVDVAAAAALLHHRHGLREVKRFAKKESVIFCLRAKYETREEGERTERNALTLRTSSAVVLFVRRHMFPCDSRVQTTREGVRQMV
jgi:hypothetical protein